MSKFLKIFFVCLAVAVIGLGVFFIFFGKDRNLSVYNDVNSVLQYKYNLDIYGDLGGLDVLGFANNTQEFNSEEFSEIYLIRQKMFSNDAKLTGGTEESGIFKYYGYSKYEEILTDGIKYYSNYAMLANNAPKRKAKEISSYISKYKSAIGKLYDKANQIKEMQNAFGLEGSEISSEEMIKSYEELRASYREYLDISAKILTNLRDYIIAESFNNNYSFETIAILYDSVAETIKSAMASKVEQEINFLHDASIYVDKYYEYVAEGQINYGIADEISYLLAYEDIYFNARDDYDRIFQFTHFQKYDLMHGNNNISASIHVDFVDNASIVVGILGL